MWRGRDGDREEGGCCVDEEGTETGRKAEVAKTGHAIWLLEDLHTTSPLLLTVCVLVGVSEPADEDNAISVYRQK